MALVLTRKLNESILIGDDIVVTVTRIRNKEVRIAIKAPKETPIRRDDLKEEGEDETAPG